MEFVALKIEVKDDMVLLTQPCMCEDDQVINIPTHQAKAICAAILKEVEANESF